MKPKEFMVDVKKRAASGIFNTKGGVFPFVPQAQFTTPAPTPKRYSNYNQGYNQEHGCFNCGDHNHRKSECPQRRGPRAGFNRRGNMGRNRGSRGYFRGNNNRSRGTSIVPSPQHTQSVPQGDFIQMDWPGQRSGRMPSQNHSE